MTQCSNRAPEALLQQPTDYDATIHLIKKMAGVKKVEDCFELEICSTTLMDEEDMT